MISQFCRHNILLTIVISTIIIAFISVPVDAKSPTKGGTLVFGRGGDSIGLDPAFEVDGESFKVCDNIYDTLVQYKAGTTEVEPALATMWDTSEDGLKWTFYLRKGVIFHDGTPACNDPY